MLASLANAHHDMLKFKISQHEKTELLSVNIDCNEVLHKLFGSDQGNHLTDIYFEYYFLIHSVVKVNTLCLSSVFLQHYAMLDCVICLNQTPPHEILARHYRLVHDTAFAIDLIFDQLISSHSSVQNFLLYKLSSKRPDLLRLKTGQIRIISKLGFMMLRVVRKLHNSMFDDLVLKHMRTTVRVALDPSGASLDELTTVDNEGTSLQYLVFDYYCGLNILTGQCHSVMRKFLRRTKILLSDIAR